MTQSTTPGENPARAIAVAKMQEPLSAMTPEAFVPLPYSPLGPHARLRAELLWVCRLLTFDEGDAIAPSSLRAIRLAVAAFQGEVRVQALGAGVPLGALGGATRSDSGAVRYRSKSNLRARTRDFKS